MKNKIILHLFVLTCLMLNSCYIYAEEAQIKKTILINSLPSTADIIFVSNRDSNSRRCEIYTMSINGTNVVRITESSYHHFICGVDPSKRYMVTSRAEEDTNSPSGLGDEDKRSLWIIDLTLQQEMRLTDPMNHAEGDSFSPDSYWIVFHMKLSGQENSDIYKIRRNGTQLTQLTNTPNAIEGDPSWSPDGTKIVFDYLDSELPRFVLKTMDINGGNIETVYDGGAGVSTPSFPPGNYDPSWSPDGEWLIYERAISFNNENWGSGIWHIFKVRIDGTDATDLSQAGGHTAWAEFLPSFSPDGNFIIFSAFYEAENPNNSLDDVLVMDTNGGSVIKVSSSPYSDKYPSWILTQQDITNQIEVNQGRVKIQGGGKGYINPLKGEKATIFFKASQPGNIKIKIYTINGKLVWEKNIYTNSDDDFIIWDCRNKSNSMVSSGVYILHIKGPGLDTTKKIAVVR